MGDFDVGTRPDVRGLLKSVARGETGGLELIAHEERRVYVHRDAPGYVFKREPPRSDQNREEIRTWQQAGPAFRALAAPVVDSTPDGEWLVMPRADRLATEAEAQALKERLDAADWGCIDFRADNVGVFGGTPKLVDYESCREKRFMRDWMLEKWL